MTSAIPPAPVNPLNAQQASFPAPSHELTSPLSGVVPAQPGRSYASATKTATPTTSTPAGASSAAQNAKPASDTPVNGANSMAQGGSQAVNTVPNGTPNNIEHGRKPSMIIDPAGASGYIPNGGPVSAGVRPPISFGSIDNQRSPMPATSMPNQSQSSSLATPQANPRATTPTHSPSPIPQPPASGGRPPTMQNQSNGMQFGSMGGEAEQVCCSMARDHVSGTDFFRRCAQTRCHHLDLAAYRCMSDAHLRSLCTTLTSDHKMVAVVATLSNLMACLRQDQASGNHKPHNGLRASTHSSNNSRWHLAHLSTVVGTVRLQICLRSTWVAISKWVMVILHTCNSSNMEANKCIKTTIPIAATINHTGQGINSRLHNPALDHTRVLTLLLKVRCNHLSILRACRAAHLRRLSDHLPAWVNHKRHLYHTRLRHHRHLYQDSSRNPRKPTSLSGRQRSLALSRLKMLQVISLSSANLHLRQAHLPLRLLNHKVRSSFLHLVQLLMLQRHLHVLLAGNITALKARALRLRRKGSESSRSR